MINALPNIKNVYNFHIHNLYYLKKESCSVVNNTSLSSSDSSPPRFIRRSPHKQRVAKNRLIKIIPSAQSTHQTPAHTPAPPQSLGPGADGEGYILSSPHISGLDHQYQRHAPIPTRSPIQNCAWRHTGFRRQEPVHERGGGGQSPQQTRWLHWHHHRILLGLHARGRNRADGKRGQRTEGCWRRRGCAGCRRWAGVEAVRRIWRATSSLPHVLREQVLAMHPKYSSPRFCLACPSLSFESPIKLISDGKRQSEDPSWLWCSMTHDLPHWWIRCSPRCALYIPRLWDFDWIWTRTVSECFFSDSIEFSNSVNCSDEKKGKRWL
jgi:hypothetical protein